MIKVIFAMAAFIAAGILIGTSDGALWMYPTSGVLGFVGGRLLGSWRNDEMAS